MKASSATVHIPEPCPVKLAEMNPVPGGFHCASCSKVVVDFREKSNEEILNAIRNAGENKTCGIFRKGQATRGSKPTFELARFAAAVLLVFGSFLFSSCEDQATIGKLCDPDSKADSIAAVQALKADPIRTADSVYISDTLTMHTDSVQCTIGWMEPPIEK